MVSATYWQLLAEFEMKSSWSRCYSIASFTRENSGGAALAWSHNSVDNFVWLLDEFEIALF